MKKSLVLAMAMALGVTASAYAANPFSDVPAGHWAYDSIDKLAAAGVIDGMGDGTYQGDKTMTRYEMAQIVAKAMAKGANVDKLAAEFADELDNLGVRVANLEKKADNVKINGEIRFRTFQYGGSKNQGSNDSYQARSRIFINGQINKDWTYTSMLENIQKFGNASTVKGVGEEDTSFQRAFVKGRIGGVKVTAGRYAETLEDGNLYDTRADGVVLSYGKKVNVTVGYAQLSNKCNEGTSKGTSVVDGNGKLTYGVVSVALNNKANAHVGYYKAENVNKLEKEDTKILAIGADYKLTKGLKLSALYMKSDLDEVAGKNIDDDAIVVGLNFKGVSAAKPGSYGIWAKYYDQAAGTVLAHTMNGNASASYKTDGFKGYGIGADYALAKNVIGTVEWFDLQDKNDSDKKDKTLFTSVVFKF